MPSTHHFFALLLVLAAFLFQCANAANTTTPTGPAGVPMECANLCNGQALPCSLDIISTNSIKLAVELNNNIESRFYPFCIPIDNMAQISIVGSHDFLMQSSGSYVRLWLSGNISSTARPYNDRSAAEGGWYSAFFTAMINLDNGYTRSNTNTTLIWEDSCSSDICILDPTYKCIGSKDCAVDSRNPPLDGSGTAGVNLFVAFTGFDSKLNRMQSAGSLPTKFRSFAWNKYLG